MLGLGGYTLNSEEPDSDREYILRLRLRRVDGKFAIYSFDYGDGKGTTRPVTAANAVRQVAKYVAETIGTHAVEIEDVIACAKSDLQQSSNAKMLKTHRGEIYVRTNFSRQWAESTMQTLLTRLTSKKVKVYRAGDLLAESVASDGRKGQECERSTDDYQN